MSDSREGPIWARHGEGDEPGRPRRPPALALWVALLAAALLVGALLATVLAGGCGVEPRIPDRVVLVTIDPLRAAKRCSSSRSAPRGTSRSSMIGSDST